jgi:hypothetical protein
MLFMWELGTFCYRAAFHDCDDPVVGACRAASTGCTFGQKLGNEVHSYHFGDRTLKELQNATQAFAASQEYFGGGN